MATRKLSRKKVDKKMKRSKKMKKYVRRTKKKGGVITKTKREIDKDKETALEMPDVKRKRTPITVPSNDTRPPTPATPFMSPIVPERSLPPDQPISRPIPVKPMEVFGQPVRSPVECVEFTEHQYGVLAELIYILELL